MTLPAMKTLTTPDGGTISYHQVGSGPGLIVLHGALQRWHDYRDLADLLADTFTVYLPDRRGRGASSPLSPDYTRGTEAADLAALAHHTGARLVFGVSISALITIYACLALPRGTLAKAVCYEPPVLVTPARHERFLVRLREQVAAGDTAGALLTAMAATQMGPWLLRVVPQWLARPVVAWFLAGEAAARAAGRSDDGTDPQPEVGVLVPTILGDFELVKEMVEIETEAAELEGVEVGGPEVLFMSGAATQPHLIRSCEYLERSAPGSTHVSLPGLGHLGAGNRKFGGSPEVVAKELRAFFLCVDE